jgi:hypothetical protein
LPGAEAALDACRADLGEADFAAAWSAGHRLSLEAALDLALTDCEGPLPGRPTSPPQ